MQGSWQRHKAEYREAGLQTGHCPKIVVEWKTARHCVRIRILP